MEYSAVILESAYSEISSIVEYLTQNLNSPQAASDFIDELFYQLDLVCNNPYIFAVSKNPKLHALGYRSFFIHKYIALYKITNQNVVLAHVFHQTQNYAKLV